MATAEALSRWEPSLKLTRVDVLEPKPGAVSVVIAGQLVKTGRPEGKPITLTVPLTPPSHTEEVLL